MAQQLKEIKIPKYVKGMDFDDYYIKLIHAASTRGEMQQVLNGEFMSKIPGYTLNTTSGLTKRGALDADQEAMEKENGRAFAELVMAMPLGGLSRLVSEAKSQAFPHGCAYTAIKILKKKVGKLSASTEALLKKDFSRSDKIKKETNPAKYMEKLIEIKVKLEKNFNYIKTEQDILDQMTVILPDEYMFTKHEIQKARRNNATLSLDDIMDELEERYEELKSEKRKKKRKNF